MYQTNMQAVMAPNGAQAMEQLLGMGAWTPQQRAILEYAKAQFAMLGQQPQTIPSHLAPQRTPVVGPGDQRTPEPIPYSPINPAPQLAQGEAPMPAPSSAMAQAQQQAAQAYAGAPDPAMSLAQYQAQQQAAQAATAAVPPGIAPPVVPMPPPPAAAPVPPSPGGYVPPAPGTPAVPADPQVVNPPQPVGSSPVPAPHVATPAPAEPALPEPGDLPAPSSDPGLLDASAETNDVAPPPADDAGDGGAISLADL